jgi:hypothetical protein
MAKQDMGPLGIVDLLTNKELSETMGHHFDHAVRDWYRGLDFLQFYGNGNGTNIITLPGADSGYTWSYKLVAAQLAAPTGAVYSTPAVPASGIQIQNPNSGVAQVVVSGGTVTGVVVNGIAVGVGDGTYYVPAYGSIGVTYSVAPTWAWSNASAPAAPILSIYPSDNTNVACVGTTVSLANNGNYDAVQTWSGNQVVLKDSRNITLFSSVVILNWRILALAVPTEMQGKLNALSRAR